MVKDVYGAFTKEMLQRAIHKWHDQHNAYRFGEQLADKVYEERIEESDVPRRIDLACKRNEHFNKEYIEYAYDRELEWKRGGSFELPENWKEAIKAQFDKIEAEKERDRKCIEEMKKEKEENEKHEKELLKKRRMEEQRIKKMFKVYTKNK